MTAFFFRAAQRKHLRRGVRTDCQVVTEDGFQLVGEKALDVSMGGMLVRTESPPELGSSVLVSLRVPGGRQWIDAEASVRRIIWGRRTYDNCAAVGLRFDRLETLDRAILSGGLTGHPPPLPTRRSRKDYATTISMIHRAPW